MKKVYKTHMTKAATAIRKGTVGILCIVMTILVIIRVYEKRERRTHRNSLYRIFSYKN
jgi:hypothetical protein